MDLDCSARSEHPNYQFYRSSCSVSHSNLTSLSSTFYHHLIPTPIYSSIYYPQYPSTTYHSTFHCFDSLVPSNHLYYPHNCSACSSTSNQP